MGQYFKLINADKKQYVHAHRIGNGLKIGEQTGWKYSTEQVAKLLLSDHPSEVHPLIGSWRDDNLIGFIGDYGGSHGACGRSVPDEIHVNAEKLYGEADDWTDISEQVRGMMTAVFGITYTGDGWLDIVEPGGAKAHPAMTPDMILS